jgi:uncharacterized protein YbbC (DUF1343 family)
MGFVIQPAKTSLFNFTIIIDAFPQIVYIYISKNTHLPPRFDFLGGENHFAFNRERGTKYFKIAIDKRQGFLPFRG